MTDPIHSLAIQTWKDITMGCQDPVEAIRVAMVKAILLPRAHVVAMKRGPKGGRPPKYTAEEARAIRAQRAVEKYHAKRAHLAVACA